jgi:hypothetical protein
MDRRTFVKSTLGVLGAPIVGEEAAPGKLLSPRRDVSSRGVPAEWTAQDDPRPPKGERPYQESAVQVENPGGGVPVSLIIDDSTCLVNMAHYGIPQFRQAFPDRYGQDWKSLPREIPDAFVRRFVEWSRRHGVKGKYSIVPYPACVGWVDRFLPGWSKTELEQSLELVREEVTRDWDIHPEMISHTRVIDLSTGRPYREASPAYMENWEWSQDKSADVLAEYMAYALRVLKQAGLPCEGITSPGTFGRQNRPNYARAVLEAVRDVYGAEVPHFFRDLYTDPDQSVEPQVFLADGLTSDDPQCVVSIIGCTGDWFGGWDGLTPGSADRFITPDLERGRMVEVIESGEPALMVCHWPGIYYNGEEVGFDIFKTVVRRLEQRYDHLTWMKPSRIARYWAARELTEIRRSGDELALNAPFAADRFTLSVPEERSAEGERAAPVFSPTRGENRRLRRVESGPLLEAGTWGRRNGRVTYCFDLPAGESLLRLA